MIKPSKKPRINRTWIRENCKEVHCWQLRLPYEAWDENDIYDPYAIQREDIFNVFDNWKNCAYFCGQQEEGPNGYAHYQLFVITDKEISTSEVRKLFLPVKYYVNIHWKKAISPVGSLYYCTKASTRVDGPWEGNRGGTHGDMKIRSLAPPPPEEQPSILDLFGVSYEDERTKSV